MTRRIALAILLTSLIILVVGGAASYAAIRRALLEELDASLVLRASSLPEVLGVASDTKRSVPAGDRYVIKNPLGQTLARPAAGPASPRPAVVRNKTFATLADGSRVRTVTVSFAAPGIGEAGPAASAAPLTVVYSGSAERFHRLLTQLASILTVVGVALSAVVAAVAVTVARTALRPLRSAAATISDITDQTLDRRLDVSSFPEEITPVGERMNQMLARLEHGLRQRKQFLADAAHELRTPVTGLMTTIEVALRRRPQDADALASALKDCLSDTHVLRRLVETLLEQFRIEADPAAGRWVEVDVSSLLDECADAVATLSRQKEVTIIRSYAPGLKFRTHRQRLRSIVSNLLSNGVEYNVAGGRVEVSCGIDGGGLILRLANTGPGIAEADLPHVFEPFYRSVSPAGAGDAHAGLGLYLVKSHIEALGGGFELSSRAGGGCEFRVRLPGAGGPAPAPPANAEIAPAAALAPDNSHAVLM